MDIKVSVIISTYNSEEWLKKVLWGFDCQTYKNFEVIIADDGSGVKTEILLDTMDSEVFYPLVHVWQEDELGNFTGYQQLTEEVTYEFALNYLKDSFGLQCNSGLLTDVLG